MPQNGLKPLKTDQNGSKWLKMVQTGSKWLLMARNSLKWFKLVLNGSKWFNIKWPKWLKIIQNSFDYERINRQFMTKKERRTYQPSHLKTGTF